MKIKEIYLLTNRNTLFFDERGEQIIDLQEKFSWEPVPTYDHHKVEKGIIEIIKDSPKIYIAKFMDWKHEITLDEFCSLLGYGPWYWKYKKEQALLQVEQENSCDTD